MKVGDKVLQTTGSGFNRSLSIAEITGETKTLWKVGGYAYRKDDLSLFGNKYGGRIQDLNEANQEAYDEYQDNILRKQLANKIRQIDLPNHLTTAELQEILNKLTGEQK